MIYKRLGEVLTSVGVITEEQLNNALLKQKEEGGRLGNILQTLGYITESQLIEALVMNLGVDYVDLSRLSIPAELIKFVPKTIAQKYDLVPIRLEQDKLFIAMADPLNFPAIEDVRKSSGKQVIQMISNEAAIDRAIVTLYGNEGAARAIEQLRSDVHIAPAPIEASSTAVDEDKADAPIIRLVNSIIENAVVNQCSDIHLQPREDDMIVRIRVDGMLRNEMTIPPEVRAPVISRLKVMSGLDTSERMIPQDGRASVRVRGEEIDLRVSTLPTIFGEKMVIRILHKLAQIQSRSGMGMDEHSSARLDTLMKNHSGVMLITGPTGSGKSSTMNVMIGELNKETVNIVTLEDPVEYNMLNISQVQIDEKVGMTFAGGLRSILRQDPDIIAVGEIRDGETAEIAMRAAVTGHLVISTIHTNDSVSTIDRLYDIGVAPYMVANALKGVISQRLVRRICPDCAEAYEPDDAELLALGLERTPGMKFYRGKGCPNCRHTGYRGRRAVFEILLINTELRKAIHRGAAHEELLALAKEDGFRTLRDNCIDLVLSGLTTAEEAERTIISAED